MNQPRSAGSVRPRTKPYSTDLITFKSDDGVALDGALYVPQQVEPIDTALLFIHGKTSNFYSGAGRFLPPMLAGAGITGLSINMRFHDLGYTRKVNFVVKINSCPNCQRLSSRIARNCDFI